MWSTLCLAVLAQATPQVPALERFRALPAAQQRELIDYLELDLDQRGLFVRGLIRFTLRNEPQPDKLPNALDTVWFEPSEHAPAQPIPRRWLAPESSAARAAEREILGGIPARKLRSGFRYQAATRHVVRLPEASSLERIFANALQGYSPGHDQAEATIECWLDDGSEQRTLAAFAHAYTDRVGNAYPGITLYDAWASGANLEMPDVDTLGLYHSLVGDRTRYVAPVPGPQQEPLYKTLGEYFRPAHRHYGLRRALAACYLEGEPAVRDGYGGMIVNFHWLWENARSTPSELLPQLPPAAQWQNFLDACVKKGRDDLAGWEAALTRQKTLRNDAQSVAKAALEALAVFEAR